MSGLSAKTRIAIGQAFILLSVLLTAWAIGLMPDPQETALAGRIKLCEAVAANGSALASQNDERRLATVLRFIAQQNPEIISAAVRRHDGRLIAEIGDHASQWTELANGESTAEQIQVPIRAGSRKWGNVEVRFSPLQQSGLFGYLRTPRVRFVGFVTAASLLIFMFYLGKMLQHLDPSKVVPKRVRETLNTLAEGLLVVDREGRIVLSNQVFSDVTGIAADQLIGRRAEQLPWQTEPDTNGEVKYPWQRALEIEAMVTGLPIKLIDKNGESRSFLANCFPVLGHDNKYRGVFATFEDVTELERNKVEISKAKEAAEAANHAKSEFLARMSHEIRTPMNAILGFTEVLRRGFEGSSEERREYLNTIHSSGQHLLDLINDILDLSKVEAGKLEVEHLPCSPAQIVTQVVSILGERARHKGISLDAQIAGPIPESIVSDPVRLRQILMNLVGNAIKFTESGGVKIQLRYAEAVTDADKTGSIDEQPRVIFDVVDTGIGISAQAIDRIFEPFSQADTSITRRFGGTGLGLAICRRFVDLLGGQLKATSELGVGSVFTVTLPTGSTEGVRLVSAAEAVGSQSEKADLKVDIKLPPARVLVVDDGAENRKLVELVLRRAGCRVEAAFNGQQAVDRVLNADLPTLDIILMDIEMPVMDGYRAARLLRERGVTTPIFALTAHALKGAEQKCEEAGFSGHLAKPISIDTLLHVVRQNVPGDPVDSPIEPTPAFEPVTPIKQNPGSSPAHDAIISTLPLDDAEFRDIVREFVGRLRERFAEMEAAWSAGDMRRLQPLAHWLKGSGGTAGFEVLTLAARQLEEAVKTGNAEQTGLRLTELRNLVARTVAPEESAIVAA